MATRRATTTGGGRVRVRSTTGERGPDGPLAQPDLRGELRRFVGEHPQGWRHDDWLGLLDRLRERGHEVGDPDAVGSSLERERVAVTLEGVKGIGPQRIRSIVERYGTL